MATVDDVLNVFDPNYIARHVRDEDTLETICVVCGIHFIRSIEHPNQMVCGVGCSDVLTFSDDEPFECNLEAT